MGRRRSKTIGGTTTNVVHDLLNLVQGLSVSRPTANLLTGLGIDETLTRTDAGGSSTLCVDALRSTLALVDTPGNVHTSYTFEPFGTKTASGVTSTNPMQFTGRENDGTGFYYYRARYYDPQSGRFLSEDPAGMVDGSTNLYEYALNNPTGFSDPLGLWILWVGPSATGATGPVGGTIGVGFYLASCGQGLYVTSGQSQGLYAGANIGGGFGRNERNFPGEAVNVEVGIGGSAYQYGTSGGATGYGPGFGIAASTTTTRLFGRGKCGRSDFRPYEPPPPWRGSPLPPLSPALAIDPHPLPRFGPR
jgi:RHS repeat-associated protein